MDRKTTFRMEENKAVYFLRNNGFESLEKHKATDVGSSSDIGPLEPRSHGGLRPCCDLFKTSHVVKSQVDLIRARARS